VIPIYTVFRATLFTDQSTIIVARATMPEGFQALV
jgi:hypothetical protein